MDQGVIRSLKAKYRAKVIRKYINAMESNKELPKITILDAMAMLEHSWSALPDTTVINWFKKAGISKESEQDSNQDTDDPFAQLSEMLDELRALGPNLAPDSLTAETCIDTDKEVATSIQSLPSDEELLHEFTIEILVMKMLKWLMTRATKRNQLIKIMIIIILFIQKEVLQSHV